MAVPPRPIRTLPKSPARNTEAGLSTSLVTRIVIVTTVVLGQLFALTVALEASLLDHDGQAWLLGGFSVLSFVVVIVLTTVEPPPRAGRPEGRPGPEPGVYVARPAEPLPEGPATRGPRGSRGAGLREGGRRGDGAR